MDQRLRYPPRKFWWSGIRENRWCASTSCYYDRRKSASLQRRTADFTMDHFDPQQRVPVISGRGGARSGLTRPTHFCALPRQRLGCPTGKSLLDDRGESRPGPEWSDARPVVRSPPRSSGGLGGRDGPVTDRPGRPAGHAGSDASPPMSASFQQAGMSA